MKGNWVGGETKREKEGAISNWHSTRSSRIGGEGGLEADRFLQSSLCSGSLSLAVVLSLRASSLARHHHNIQSVSLLNPMRSMPGKCEDSSNPEQSPRSGSSASFASPGSGVRSSAASSSPRISSSSISGHHSDRSALNLDRHSDPDGLPLAITVADAVGPNGVPPWNWREAGGNAGQNNVSYNGRVILVKWGDYTRKIGIDASAEAIKEAIKSAFGLRTRRAFWLEDEDEVVRCLDRDMPLGTYTLHLDEGLTIKICVYDESGQLQVHAEDKTLYTEEDFHEFLTRRGWTALREIGGFRAVESLDELRPGAMYQGVVRLGE